MLRLIRRVLIRWDFYRARRRLHRVCPELAAIPRQARDRSGRFTSTAKARRNAIHNRLRIEVQS